MQPNRLLLLLFVIAALPIIIVASNHNIFFILIGLSLLFTSGKEIVTAPISKVKTTSFDSFAVDSEDEAETIEELEEMTNIDIKKFYLGLNFIKILITILFFVYCALFIKTTFVTVILALLILYKSHQLIALLTKSVPTTNSTIMKLQSFINFLVSLATIFIIMVVAYVKCKGYLSI